VVSCRARSKPRAAGTRVGVPSQTPRTKAHDGRTHIVHRRGDPVRGTAGFHDDQVDLVFLEDCLELVSIGGSVKELVLSSF